ncbi:MAG: hypothetical protein R3314_04000 [Longimicrobiales bacterium]|nr:hypothetical protein [Longimicrobiales bacterium]
MKPLVLERSRALLHATGRDPVKMVHGLVTSDLEALDPEQGAYGLFLTAKGRVIADARILEDADGGLWIDVDPGATEPLRAHLKKFVPPLFATFEDVSEDWAVVGVYGDGATEVAAAVIAELGGPGALPADAPEERVVRLDAGFALRTLLTGDDGWDLFVPAARRDAVVDRLLEAGGRPGDPDVVDALRIAAGRPSYGRELTEDVIPLEAGLLDRAIDQEKGCYTGQEVIVRILHRGHVNRHLRRLEFEGRAPAPGTELFEPGVEKARGVVTSAAENEAGAIGLGYVRREVEPPAELHIGSPDGPGVVVTALDD